MDAVAPFGGEAEMRAQLNSLPFAKNARWVGAPATSWAVQNIVGPVLGLA
ncbi:bsr4095 [Bradyrhizobium diazoefficiens USDA 110]|uniref:Bsr4095 protein n=1 Tax=Bradyrhizobium diazoefficiens (strain JCM 10833 / BCRC 13528 / IAM 13628 / NBRC 14792 / USDA 110) TaxID=224911 RepID=Q89MU7_BRADU|nr:bsr4095 [Bradyrhizobium diazoefficiens USDA 110]